MLSARFPPLHRRWTLFNSLILTDGYFMFFAFDIAGDLNGDDQKIENLRAEQLRLPTMVSSSHTDAITFLDNRTL